MAAKGRDGSISGSNAKGLMLAGIYLSATSSKGPLMIDTVEKLSDLAKLMNEERLSLGLFCIYLRILINTG